MGIVSGGKSSAVKSLAALSSLRKNDDQLYLLQVHQVRHILFGMPIDLYEFD